MTLFTGYGRGWAEERAKTRLGRLLQRLREPATTSTYLACFALVVFVAVASAAFSAPNPEIETPPLTLSKPKDAKVRCILKMTTQRFFIRSDGRMEYAGGFTMWTACDR